jgi:hypothetical protein
MSLPVLGYNEVNNMSTDTLIFLGFLGLWLLLSMVVLPRLGVPT